MAALVSSVTAIITGALGWLTSTVAVVMDEGSELLLFFVLIPMIGVGIGLLRRFIR